MASVTETNRQRRSALCLVLYSLGFAAAATGNVALVVGADHWGLAANVLSVATSLFAVAFILDRRPW